jgi:hypothetical protein
MSREAHNFRILLYALVGSPHLPEIANARLLLPLVAKSL